MIAWPSIPSFLLSGHSYQSMGNATPIDSDIPETARRRFTGNVADFSASVYLDAADLVTFRTFWRDTLVNGVRRFRDTDRVLGGDVDMLFRSAPKYSAIGGIVRVDVQLRVMDPTAQDFSLDFNDDFNS